MSHVTHTNESCDACAHTHTYTHTHACTRTHVHTHTRAHTHTHTLAHTQEIVNLIILPYMIQQHSGTINGEKTYMVVSVFLHEGAESPRFVRKIADAARAALDSDGVCMYVHVCHSVCVS